MIIRHMIIDLIRYPLGPMIIRPIYVATDLKLTIHPNGKTVRTLIFIILFGTFWFSSDYGIQSGSKVGRGTKRQQRQIILLVLSTPN